MKLVLDLYLLYEEQVSKADSPVSKLQMTKHRPLMSQNELRLVTTALSNRYNYLVVTGMDIKDCLTSWDK